LVVVPPQGKLGVVEVLMEEGAAVGITNNQGRTARDLAVLTGHQEIADRLGKAKVGVVTPCVARFGTSPPGDCGAVLRTYHACVCAVGGGGRQEGPALGRPQPQG
jgi:hypothetical protein